MIVPKLTEEELAIYEILRHPVWCGDFLRELELDEGDDPWVYSPYQERVLLDFHSQVSMRAGRAVGKTVSLVDKMTWQIVNKFFDTILFTVPNRSHLDPVFLGIQKRFRAHPMLQFWMGRNSVNSQQFIVKFLNGFILVCRIAGNTGTGVNVVGLHVPVVYLDESAYYSWGCWLELQQVMNDWQPGHQLMVTGVPDGRRERNVCYQCDTADSFTHHRISAYENPRFTEETEKRALEQFGGVDSQDFIHQVLGEHGVPIFSMFDRELMKIETYHYPSLKVTGSQMDADPFVLDRILINLPIAPSYCDNLIAGIDLGYTDPTSIIALYHKDGLWRILFRLELHQIRYDIQEKFFDKLDTKLEFDYIGFDVGAGGQGKSLYHNLLNRDEYQDRSYEKKLLPVDFGGTTIVGYDDAGEGLKERIKPFSASKLQQLVNSHEIAFSSIDEALLSELERVTYTKTSSGNVVYKVATPAGGERGNDHNFAALLAFTMVLFEKIDSISAKKRKIKLFTSRWLT